MASTTQTLQLLDNPSWAWTKYPVEGSKFSGVEFNFHGYRLKIDEIKRVVSVLSVLSRRSQEFAVGTERFFINERGMLYFVDGDIWLNPEIQPKDVLGSVEEFSEMVKNFLEGELGE